ncbi:MAG: ParB N-terminal domain-containing protein [Deltaproteobacteria bacterium]|nr:ParB N-terminal domain-containing protein [Deltaproteobacteria bacterium]MBK8012081.1 ParB N-terminal domain-containing protein [Deltaproteobacteria bacterium]MBK8015154.1 ParB N-terminal domain-containing protein [Deltaproteobacteria bacterium]
MELEIGQLELRYEKLRRRNARKERQLVGSLAEKGQLLPVVVVRGDDARHVLVDGYKRVRALKSLRHDLVRATLWELGELEAVLLERLMRTSESDGALEQGWLLEDLNERFGLSLAELSRCFDKSQSWVSRRLALVRALPREVQDRVQSGSLGAHAAMKYLVPMARAKRSDCLRLVKSLADGRPSTREVGALYAAWVSGNAKTRELVVTQPFVVLRLREQAAPLVDSASEKRLFRKLVDDFGILIGTSRRARTRLKEGALSGLVPPEALDLQHATQQAKWECESLFRSALSLLMHRTSQSSVEGVESATLEAIDAG